MPRARLLKPDFFRSEDIGLLPLGARLLFQGLWTLADRQGRLLDRPRRFAIDLFPYDADPPIEQWLGAMVERGLIVRYTAVGHECIQIVNFVKHQNPHPREPSFELPEPCSHNVGQSPDKKLPGKDEPCRTAGRTYMSSPDLLPLFLASGSGRAIPVVPSTSTDVEPESPDVEQQEYPASFLEVWVGTGKHGVKFKAMKAWRAHGKPPWNRIRPAWEAYMASDRPSAGYVQDLSTWLNGKGWTQEWQPAAARRQGKSAGNIDTLTAWAHRKGVAT